MNRIALLICISLVIMAAGLVTASSALATVPPYPVNASGAGCSAIGTWNNTTKTCTLTRDIAVNNANGIQLNGSNFTLDGGGHTLRGNNAGGTYGVVIAMGGQTGVTVRNLRVTGFNFGVYTFSLSSSTIQGNYIHDNGFGLYLSNTSDSNTIKLNTFTRSTGTGLALSNSDNNRIYQNNLIANGNHASANAGSTGNAFDLTGSGNYWDTYDSPGEGCVNNAPFNYFCDGAYAIPNTPGDADNFPFVLRDVPSRRDWTWYDDVGGDSWVLLANKPDNTQNLMYRLVINSVDRNLSQIGSYGPGYVRPGEAIYNKYPGLVNGPVTASSSGELFSGIASQRMLWPKGGSSLEELPGTTFIDLSHHLYWPWYDMASPGFKNWILISNPNSYQISYKVKIGGVQVGSGSIPAFGRATPQYPGVIGGPVEVIASNAGGDPVYIIASQRILSNNDTAFNEVNGTPNFFLNTSYSWTWYDMTGGAQNWVLIANPATAIDGITPSAPIWYEIWIGGVEVKRGGPIPAGGNVTPTFPGRIGGPVQVRTFSDAAHTVPARSIASQRSIWGPSFEEVPGSGITALIDSHYWTWYDMTGGAQNWILVANPTGASGPIYYEVWIGGVWVKNGGPIAPGGYETPWFPGRIGGPVQVKSFTNASHTVAANSLATQRVLWNGHFNEVWSQY